MHCPSGNYDTLSSCISEYNQQITFQGHNPQVPNSSIALQLDTALHEHIAYSHDIDPHSYDVDPLEEGMAFKEQSLFACKQAVVQLYKDITFSFSWTLHRE